MEFDDLSQSGIRRVADYSPYLDQLAGLASEMGLKQRSNLVHLERCLNNEWSLGQNSILSWCGCARNKSIYFNFGKLNILSRFL